ncbi:EAL domain-containing protein [Fodinisporobacter ferrooxydans]|uniref:EAL domain-containing protein n=1 Tax=Fodinisporobacter ferrooxydans TaxID=2901836 RepID=A0ABY4CQQ1_9BACL|nr:EAL domain-containing protein [Alicyclobacillaceae bacterium MYW30-H2]
MYQPIWDISSWDVMGYESFFRSDWNSNPEEVFQSAMKTNHIYELDTKSIIKAASTFHRVYETNKTMLFLNIFPSTMLNPEFFSFIEQLIHQTTISCQHIVFEINESEKIENTQLFLEAMLRLKNYGFLLAMDDVGKGETSIQKLFELKPDFIKIDKYFSNDLSFSDKKQKFIRFLVDVCKDHGKVILEGIEKPEDLAAAKSLGVPIAQGFLLGKPDKMEFS